MNGKTSQKLKLLNAIVNDACLWWLGYDSLAERADEFCKQLLLTFWLSSIMQHDVLPDLNLFGGFQLEVLGQSAVLDSVDSAIGELVLPLLGTAHAIEGTIGLPEHEGCQCMGT